MADSRVFFAFIINLKLKFYLAAARVLASRATRQLDLDIPVQTRLHMPGQQMAGRSLSVDKSKE